MPRHSWSRTPSSSTSWYGRPAFLLCDSFNASESDAHHNTTIRELLWFLQVTPNLYGNLIINVGSGLVGGPGLVAGANYGLHGEAVFEPGARHVAADIQGANVANPTGTPGLQAAAAAAADACAPPWAKRVHS